MVLAVGVWDGAFTGFVKGNDGWGHLSKIVLVLRDFPHVDWNYDWYNGSPFFMGGYPPLFYFSAAALAAAGIDPASAMNALMVASYLAMTLSLYGLVRIATGRRAAGVVASLLLLASPAVWAHLVSAGLYPRVFGMGFVSLSLMLAVLYVRKPSFVRCLALVASIAGALSSHVILGAIALGSVFLVLLVVPDDTGRTRPFQAALVALPLLVASYYYLPLAFYPQPQSPLSAVYSAESLGALFFPGDSAYSALPTTLLPVAVFAVIVWFRTRRDASRLANRLIVVCGLITAALLLYTVGPLPIRVSAVGPAEVVFFLSWFAAALAGLALGSIRFPAGRLWERGAAGTMVAIAALSIVAVIPTVVHWSVNLTPHPELVTAGWQPIDSAERSFRVASPSDNLSEWLNGIYDVPQTRGYGAQLQVQNPDQQYWLENTAWPSAVSEEQRSFILDWYAAGWLWVPTYSPATAAIVPKLLARPDLYQALPSADGRRSLTFSYLRRTPIASVTNVNTALVVGGTYNYDLVFRSLSYGDFGSASVIPVRGGPYLDDYSAADLAGFDEIVLYGYQFHDQARALNLLANYVRGGGGLIVEASGSAFVQASGMPDPLPVTNDSAYEVNGDWAFTSASSPATDGINFASFGEALYAGGPWTVSVATGVKSWARPVLWSGGRPVVVVGQLGQGHVLWSGLNLPYHVGSYQNSEESRFLGTAIGWAARNHDQAPANFTASVDGPEQTTLTVATTARGVLFKESFYPNWHAYAGGRELKLYPAGPSFMYAQLPTGMQYPASVVLRYEKSPLDWAGIALSVATVIALLTMFAWWPRVAPSMSSAFSRLRTRLWEPDE